MKLSGSCTSAAGTQYFLDRCEDVVDDPLGDKAPVLKAVLVDELGHEQHMEGLGRKGALRGPPLQLARVNDVVHGRRAVTPSTALRLSSSSARLRAPG